MRVARKGIPIQRRPLNADPRPGRPGPDIEGGVLDAYPGSRVPRRASRRGIGKPDPRLGRPRAHVRRCRCSPAHAVQRVLPASADDEPVPHVRGSLRAVTNRPPLRDSVARAMPEDDATAGNQIQAGRLKRCPELLYPPRRLRKRHYSTPEGRSSQLKVSLSLSLSLSLCGSSLPPTAS